MHLLATVYPFLFVFFPYFFFFRNGWTDQLTDGRTRQRTDGRTITDKNLHSNPVSECSWLALGGDQAKRDLTLGITDQNLHSAMGFI